MFKRPVPKRTALILASVILALVYTLSFIVCINLKNVDGSLFNSSFGSQSANTAHTPSVSDKSHPSSDVSNSIGSLISSDVSSDISSSVSSQVVGELSSDNPSNISSNSFISSSASHSGNSLLSSNSSSTVSKPNPTPIPDPEPVANGFTASIWISIFDLTDNGLQGMTKQQFTSLVTTMFTNAKSLGATSVFCHVRPNGDALYKSSYFPYSKYLTGTEGKDPGYDPLEIMVSVAHSKGLKIHAWVNPYRISATSTSLTSLADSNPAKKWLTDNNTANDRNVLTATDSSNRKGLYYNPAVSEVQDLIVNGIKEICENYDVDGIHIDDYFYPTTDSSFDSIEYNRYSSNGGTMSLANWRRENVNTLVRKLYSAVHSFSGLEFGISPAGNITRNYNELYADVEKWMSTTGYIDYIIPQIYYGYEYPNSKYTYTALLNQWMSLSRLKTVDIYIGLGNYRITDQSEGYNEWLNNNDIIARQTSDAYKQKADGVVLFSYCDVFGTSTREKQQTANFKEVFKDLK